MTKNYLLRLCTLSLPVLALCTASLSEPAHARSFKTKETTVLKADGPDTGKSAYKLIRKAFGDKAMESPDLYKSNHPGEPHIIEETDDVVGPHFVFLAHRDDDWDRDRTEITDRQRNEIKAYDKSKKRLKAYEGETLQYRWKFKLDDGFEVSKNFTHFFQMKAKNLSKSSKSKDSDSFPVITFTGYDRGDGSNEFQIRHSPSLTPEGERLKFTKLIQTDMAKFTGQWIEFFVQITFADEGQLIVTAKNIETGEALIEFEQSGLDMWRGESREDFSRPKWGIYRSLKQKESLRADEEKARFADFEIRKGTLE